MLCFHFLYFLSAAESIRDYAPGAEMHSKRKFDDKFDQNHVLCGRIVSEQQSSVLQPVTNIEQK